MARKKPNFEYTIICDDIREEVNNKLSFIGVYGSNILVSKIPFVFPKLCFITSYKNIREGDLISIQLKTPSGKQLGKTINAKAPQQIKDFASFLTFAIFSPLNIKEEGLHKLLLTLNDNPKWSQEIEFTIKVPDKAE